MSLFSRAVGGAASAGVALSSKYIDEGLAAQRAQMIADLQRTGAKNIREDDDAFRNDPTRVQRDRERRAGDVEFDSKAKRDATLRDLNDTELRGAKSAAGDADAADVARRALSTSKTLLPQEAERETVMARARSKVDLEKAAEMLPLEVRRAYALADAQGRAGARNREAPGADLAAKIAIVEKTLGRPMTEPEKLGLLGLAKGAASETDRVKITDEEVLPGGGSRKTERTEVRRAGGGQPADSDPLLAALEAARKAKEPKAAAAPAAAPADQANDPAREGMSLQQRAQADRRTRAQTISSKANQALQSGDPSAAQEVMGAPNFSLLDDATKQALRRAVYGK